MQLKEQQAIQNVGDAVAGVATLGIITEIVPVVVGIAAFLWYALRFMNWFRVNYLDKESWKGL